MFSSWLNTAANPEFLVAAVVTAFLIATRRVVKKSASVGWGIGALLAGGILFATIVSLGSRIVMAAVLACLGMLIIVRLSRALDWNGEPGKSIQVNKPVRAIAPLLLLAQVLGVGLLVLEPAAGLSPILDVVEIVDNAGSNYQMPITVTRLAALFALLAFAEIMILENSAINRVVALIGAAALLLVMLVISSRPMTSAMATLLLVTAIPIISHIKFRYWRTYLHAYDIVYFARQMQVLAFLFQNYKTLVLSAASSLFVMLAVIALTAIHEPPTIVRSWPMILTAVSSVAAIIALIPLVRRKNVDFFLHPSPIAHLLASIGEAYCAMRTGYLLRVEPIEANSKSLMIERAERDESAPVAERPHIILILQESTFPPQLIPGLAMNDSMCSFFASADGNLHPLVVETFGGSTWVSEFSCLTGIAAGSYGAMKDFSVSYSHGKIRHSLPLQLRQMGYRSAAFHLLDAEFAQANVFLKSIGFDVVHDSAALDARGHEPDIFLYRHLLSWLETQQVDKNTRTFSYLATMSNHGPHREHFTEDGGQIVRVPNKHISELEEYLRRLERAIADYNWVRAELARRFPNQAFMLVHFGDHQPSFMGRCLGGGGWTNQLSRSDARNAMYQTYFAIDGINFSPHLDSSGPLHIADLSTMILEAASLPLDLIAETRRHLRRATVSEPISHAGDESRFWRVNDLLVKSGLIDLH